MTLRLRHAGGDGVLDEGEAAVAIQPFAVGEIGGHGGALGVLAMTGGAGPTRLLTVEDLLTLRDLGGRSAASGRLGSGGLLFCGILRLLCGVLCLCGHRLGPPCGGVGPPWGGVCPPPPPPPR